MNIYDEIEELLEPIDLTLDLMKKFIQPSIFKGLKSNIESIKHTVKRHEERAKKIEELVGLYQEKEKLSKNPYKNIDTKEMKPYYEWACELCALEEKIKALEEEMK